MAKRKRKKETKRISFDPRGQNPKSRRSSARKLMKLIGQGWKIVTSEIGVFSTNASDLNPGKDVMTLLLERETSAPPARSEDDLEIGQDRPMFEETPEPEATEPKLTYVDGERKVRVYEQ